MGDDCDHPYVSLPFIMIPFKQMERASLIRESSCCNNVEDSALMLLQIFPFVVIFEQKRMHWHLITIGATKQR